MEMKLLSILLTSMSCLLFVASLEERLPVSDNVLQREIQELRTKVSALESKFVSLESRSSMLIFILCESCKIRCIWLTVGVEFWHSAQTTINSQLVKLSCGIV